ncbi:hypothetical protein GW17_00046993 [Ensete ventricosum]|nr:hypothetical protein GW17_00046993 [Ensete ventricosum]RZS13351.1 hypothetical protein BHM03_00044936 [Ensete ventricosum]
MLKEIRYGGGAGRNTPKVYELKKLNPCKEKSTITKVNDEMRLRRASWESLTHSQRTLVR